MIFWIMVILFVVSLVVVIMTANNYKNAIEITHAISAALAFISGVVIIIMLVIIGANYYGIDGYIAKMHERYDSLTYQYENNIYDNANDLGKRELMVNIQNWNEDLAAKRENQDDFWVGIFTANIYDQFEFIELEEIEE